MNESSTSIESVPVPVCDAGLFFKTLLENSLVGIGILDASGKVKYCMSSVKHILGYEPASRIGKDIFSIMHPDDTPRLEEPMRDLIATPGKTITFTARFRHLNGTWKSLDLRAVNMLDNPHVEGIYINYRDVTDSLAMSKALQESELRYRNLAAISPVGIFRTDLNGKCIYVNEKYCELFGMTAEQSMGDGWTKSLHPDDAAKVWKQWKDASEDNRIFRMEHRLLTPDGKTRWVFCQAVPEKDDTGTITGYVGTVTDISDRVAIEKALRESESRYRSLASVSPVGIFTTDMLGNCTYVNEKWCELSGLTFDESLGTGWAKNIHPDDIASVREDWLRAAAQQQPSKKEYRLCHPSGKITPVYCQAVPVMDESGNVKGYIGSVTDLSERAAIEKALRESEERHRMMIENAPEAIFLVDAETCKFIGFNENALKLFGYSREELLTMSAIDPCPPVQPDGRNSKESALEKIKLALKGHKPVYEWTYRDAKGRLITCEERLVRFPPYDRKLVLGTAIDITQKKEIEKKLRTQELEYRHLASASPVGIFRTDTSGKTIYVNEKWSTITGIPANRAKGSNWLKGVHPDDRQDVWNEWRTALKKRKVSRIEFRFLTPKGKINWVLGEAVPDYDEHGNFAGYAGTITDITERVKAEKALAQTEQRNSALLKAIPDLLLRVSKDGTYLDYKPAVHFETFLFPGTFIGKKISDVMPPHIARPAMRLIRKALRTKQVQLFGYSLPHKKSGKELFFEARISPYADDEVLILVRNFSQQKAAEMLLRDSEEKWRSLVQSAPQYIATVDPHDRVTFINHMRFVRKEQIIGKTVFEVLQKSDVNKKELKRVLNDARKGKPAEMEFSITNPLGEVMWFNVKAASVKNSRKVPDLIVMALDITGRVKAEQELIQSNQKLKALYQRLETIREEEKKNIALEIHDQMGQELTAIKLGMFWLQHYIDRLEGDGFQQVKQKIKSLIELSSQTISSARRLAHQLRPVVLDSLGLIPAIEWQIEQIRKAGSIQLSFHHNISKVKLSQELSMTTFRIIQEALTNILRHAKASKATIALHARNNRLQLAIHDNGTGFHVSELKKPGKIGIFGMKERIQRWNGTFTLYSMPGKGTKIKIILPLNESIAVNHD